MNRKECDRIIVRSNEQMMKVLNWYFANQEWLDKEEFRAPIDSGMIKLREEMIDFTFERKGDDLVEIAVYPGEERGKQYISAVVTFDYRPSDHAIMNRRWPPISKDRVNVLESLIKIDKTDRNEALKYHALMLFAAYYQDIVIVDEAKNVKRTKHEAKKLRRNPGQPLQLVRKTYIVADFDEKNIPRPDGKRSYTKPDHEVTVRGFFRTSKTGKRSWVKPHARYREKGDAKRKEYVV